MKEFMAVIKLRVKGSFWMSILIIIGTAIALAAIINIMMGTAMWQINGELSLMKTVESMGIKIYLPVTLLLLTLLWRKENGTTMMALSHVNYVEDRLSISGKKVLAAKWLFNGVMAFAVIVMQGVLCAAIVYTYLLRYGDASGFSLEIATLCANSETIKMFFLI